MESNAERGRDAIDGVDGSSLLAARVRCPAQRGKVNQALCALLAERLGAPTASARMVAGLKEPARGFRQSCGDGSACGQPRMIEAASPDHCAHGEKGLRCFKARGREQVAQETCP